MGADRAILVQTDEEVEPLGVAKLLAKIAAEEQPQLIILGKQAIDDDNNATGQMLAALLGWPQGTFASKVEVADGDAHASPAKSMAASRPMKLKLPAVVTTDLRLNEPRYASLPNIMKAKSKPLATKTPDDLRRRRRSAAETLKVVEPAKRQAGDQGRDRRRAGRKAQGVWGLRNETFSSASSTMEAAVKDATLGDGHRRVEAGRRQRAGRRQQCGRRSPQAAAKIAGVGRSIGQRRGVRRISSPRPSRRSRRS